MLSEQEKIKLAQEAFQKFMNTAMRLLAEQRVLFERLLKRAEERKIEGHREKIKVIFGSKKSDFHN